MRRRSLLVVRDCGDLGALSGRVPTPQDVAAFEPRRLALHA